MSTINATNPVTHRENESQIDFGRPEFIVIDSAVFSREEKEQMLAKFAPIATILYDLFRQIRIPLMDSEDLSDYYNAVVSGRDTALKSMCEFRDDIEKRDADADLFFTAVAL